MSKDKFLIKYFWGKLLGSLLGYLVLNNWFGIVLGFATGWFIDIIFAKLSLKFNFFSKILFYFGGKQKLYRKTLFMNLGYLSKVDGVVSPQEIAFAESIFAKMNLTDKARARAIEYFQAGKFAQTEIKEQLRILQSKFKRDEKLRIEFLTASLQVCFSDEPPTNEQINKLQDFLPLISIENLEFERTYQRLLLSQPFDKQKQKNEYDRFKQQTSYNARRRKQNSSTQSAQIFSSNKIPPKQEWLRKPDFKTIWQNAWDLHKKNQAENKQRQAQNAQKHKAKNEEAQREKQRFEDAFRSRTQEREEAKRQSTYDNSSKSNFDKKSFEEAFGFKGGYSKFGTEKPDSMSYKDYHSLMQAYELLELNANATSSEIKTAYRKLASKYHPDKLASQHLGPAARISAKQKMQAVQEAYKEIRRIKGI